MKKILPCCSSQDRRPPTHTLFPYTTLFRSSRHSCPTARRICLRRGTGFASRQIRSEEHTSELQSHSDLVCRLLLEKQNDAVRAAIIAAPLHRDPRFDAVEALGGEVLVVIVE